MKGYGLEISGTNRGGPEVAGNFVAGCSREWSSGFKVKWEKYSGYPYCYSDTYSGKEFEYLIRAS